MNSLRIINAMLGRGKGGIEQALIDYNDALQLAGHEVHNIIDPKSESRSMLDARGIRYHTLSNIGAWDISAMWRLRRIVKKIEPHVSIAHGNRAISLLKRATGKEKLIAAAHNYKIHGEELGALLCATQHRMQFAHKQPRPARQIVYIPNMVRLGSAPMQRARHTPIVIGAMGRFVAKKGFMLFIDALAQLRARGIDFRAVLAGDGEEAAALKAHAKAKNLDDLLSFPGWAKDKHAFFSGIDLFCLPSSHEPFGIVLLEAMGESLPVISTRSEGPSEIIDDGVNGMLIPQDASAMATALLTLIENETLSRALGQAAYEKMQREYDIKVVSRKLDRLVRSFV